MTSLALLIQAADYLERKEREMEHGYASTLPMPEDYNSSSSSTRSSSSNSNHSSIKVHRRIRNKSKLNNSRTTHNELEKNRRAHLRTCLEKLKELVPLGPDGARHTTLGLLTRAKYFIKNLEDKDRKQNSQRETLQREQRYLRRRLDALDSHLEFSLKRRSVSESSAFSIESSTSSGSSFSESDEVDILGYGSNQSDSDEHSSSQSSSSERGVILSTRRLTIGEPTSSGPLSLQAL